MKKFFMLAIAAMALTFVTSCGPEAKFKSYMEDIIEAYEDGDLDKAEEINEEAQEWYDDLDKDDEKAVKKFRKSKEGKELIKKMEKAAEKAQKKAMEDED